MSIAKSDTSRKRRAREQAPRTSGDRAATLPASAGSDTASTTDAGYTVLPADTDHDLLTMYIAESLDHIGNAEGALLDIESAPENTEPIDVVFRAFHTIKGTSGFLALDPIQKVAHLAENLLDRARDGEIRLTGANADLALASCDVLKAMIEGLEGLGPGDALPIPKGYADLLRRLEASRATGPSEDSGSVPQAGDVPASEDEPGPADSPTDVHEDTSGPQQAHPRGTADATVRVGTQRLDSLIDMVGELVISHSMIAHDPAVAKGEGARLERNVSRTGKIVRELQDLTMALRMVPLKATFRKIARLVRDLGRKSGKPVQLVIDGEETEIDRNMVESLGDPLVHMVRNAIDHGIEPADERREAGKSETGTLHLRAYHSAGCVVIELSDDGRGLDREKILAKAIQRNLVKPGAELSDSDVLALAFRAGVSTSEEVTDVSGRGVGLDVVRKCVETLQGRIEVTSRPGGGTTFTLRLPLTLAITDGMLLRVGTERYLLPTISIQESVRPEAGTVSTVVGRGEVVMLRGELIPVLRLHRLFNVAGAVTAVAEGLLVVVEGNGRRCALLVDELLDQQQVVIKSLGKSLGRLRGVSGGAILADGRVGLVLDPGGIIDLAQTRHAPHETAAGLATNQITGNLADNDAGGTPTQVGLPSGQPGYAR